MAKNYRNRTISTREILLLILLLLIIAIGLYFGLVYYPIHARMGELEQNRAELQVRKDAAELRKHNYDRMKAALEELRESEEPLTEMPPFNNNGQQEVLAARFSAIFKGLDVTISYSDPVGGDDVYTRDVRFSFTVEEEKLAAGETVYQKTKSVLTSLLQTGFRCLMPSLTIAPIGGDILSDNVSVNLTLVFYERA